MSPQQAAYAQKRRSTRIEQAVPIVVQGVGALREPYQDQVSTISISCHGCSYQSRHEVIQGETVYLDVKLPTDGLAGCSSRARVKWAQKVPGKDRAFQIAVELEIAGNIWGVDAAPADWFPLRLPEPNGAAAPARELKVVPRKEQQSIQAQDAALNRTDRAAAPGAAASPALPAGNPLAQLMVGLGEQIQTMAAEAAATALVQEKSRLLEEVRVQLREEAVNTIRSAVSASRDEIIRQATKQLAEEQEAAVRNRHALWRRQIEQDMESVRQHLLAQGNEATERLESLVAATIERVQGKMDATRSDAVERFVSRIREQVSPMLETAKDSLRKLEGAESALKNESQTIFAELENQLSVSTNLALSKAQEDLEKETAATIAKSNETLQKLFQSFENAARGNLNALLVSAGNQMTQHLQDRSAEISREFTTGLENHTRGYLETVGKSIAEIALKAPVPPSK